MKVGDKIWVFDENHRVYREDGGGHPIYREHWRERIITDETKRSWIIGNGEKKIPKKGPHCGIAFTPEEVTENVWVHDERYQIERAVGRIDDYAMLKKIAEIIGYGEPVKGKV